MGPDAGWAFAALDRLREGCRILDAEERYRYVNAAAARQLRSTREALVGHQVLEVFPGVERSEALARIRRCRSSGVPQTVEASHTFPGGERATFDLRFEPFDDGVLILCREITGQRRAEAALAQTSRALITLSECNQALVRATDRDAFLQAVCAVAVERGGYRMAWVGIKGPGPERRVTPLAHVGVDEGYLAQLKVTWDDGPRGQGPTGRAVRHGEVVRARFIATDPTFVPWREAALARGFASSIALPIRQAGEVVGALMLYAGEPDAFDDAERGLLTELAEDLGYGLEVLRTRAARTRAEAHVAHLNAVLRGIREVNRLIGQEPDRAGLLQRSCEVLVASGAFTGAAVVLLDEAGSPEVVAEDGFGPRAGALRELTAGGALPDCAREALAGRTPVVRHDPREVCHGCPVASTHDDEDSVAVRLAHGDRTFGVLHAITRRDTAGEADELALLEEVAGDLGRALEALSLREALDAEAARSRAVEERLRQTQRLEAVGRLAGGVAHDFNNLLTVINNYAALALEGLDPAHPVRDDLAEVRRAGARAAELTRQLLAFSRRQVMNVSVLDLGEVLSEVEKMLRRVLGEDVDLRLVGDPDLGRVRADRGQIEQVIMNLAINARDAMPDGGRLVLEVRNVELDARELEQHPEVEPGAFVMLAVTDTGSGMDEQTRDHAFEPFFTTKPKGRGTGLGLSTVFGIVKQSGGALALESAPGRGAVVRIYLPRVDEVEVPARPQPADEGRGAGESVLVVEDEAAVRRLAVRILADAGYRVHAAGSGAEALALWQAEGGRFDLVLTDVVMPGMNGRELVDRLRAEVPALRVLYMSGYTEDAIVHHGVLEPGTWFLGKPFSGMELTRKVREVLGAPAARC